MFLFRDGEERNIWFWVSGGIDCLMNEDATFPNMLTWVEFPRSISVGDTATLIITVENARETGAFNLESVDVGAGFLKGFEIESVTPKPAESDDSGDYLELTYPMTIAAGDSVEFALELIAIEAGVYIGEIDIWNDDDFLSRYVQCKVVE